MTITKKLLDHDEDNIFLLQKYDILATTYDLLHEDDMIVENEQTS